MMLTPEQLANLRQAAKGGWKVELDGRGIREIVAHIDAQQARIAELESAWQAQTLNRKDQIIERQERHNDGLKARIAEWEALRDPNNLHVNLVRGFPAKLSADQLLHIAGDKYQAMAARIAELEAKAGAGNEWRRAHDDVLAALNKSRAMADGKGIELAMTYSDPAGREWKLFAVDYTTADGVFSVYIYALDHGHAGLIVNELKDTAALRGELVLCRKAGV